MRKFKTLLVITLAYLSTESQAQYDTNGYAAFLSGSETLWRRAIESKTDGLDPESGRDRFELAILHYGILNYTMKDRNEDVFDEYVDKAEANLETLIDMNHRVPEANAFYASLIGLKIAYSPWKGMFLGSKNSNMIKSAMEAEPSSPIVQQLFANYKNFTPPTWGGDIDEAISAYQNAVELYETGDSTNNWMLLESLAWLGQCQFKAGNSVEAKNAWEAALELEPDFNWVKHGLMPGLASNQ